MGLADIQAYCNGFYGTRIYRPFSGISRRWRRFGRRIRGGGDSFLQEISIPDISWQKITNTKIPRVWEHRQENGNIRISELAILAALAADCRKNASIFEIGTFDGRTTLNLALNAPLSCDIYTLDLPPDQQPKFELTPGEQHMVEKPFPGARYEKYRGQNPRAVNRIHQLSGDSASFDFSPFNASCALVFVDGSHAYDYALSDTKAAMRMIGANGIVVWHDYGIWEGVTKALDEMFDHGLDLRCINGTSLVIWQNR